MRLLVTTGDWTCSPRKAISVVFLVIPVLSPLRDIGESLVQYFDF